ncbi:MAG TPA: redoxin domain-containing protein [Planctomycetaceae bacterium]|nr:redoxin domain-containing protein [Planctomycetaceae bacterium]
MDKRLIPIFLAALVIAGVSYWKVTRDYPPQPRAEDLVFKQPAPLIPTLPDQNSEVLKFERYLGRHDIFVVFYDGKNGIENSKSMQLFRTRYAELKKRGTIVVGISDALPQESLGYEEVADESGKTVRRKKSWPFPLLTDFGLLVHQNWGRYDKETEQALEGVFYLDRAGNVDFQNGRPLPLDGPERFLNQLLGE